jgi:hypothetical protein
LGNGAKSRKDEWTGSIAVGSRPFIGYVKALLGFKAKGRDVIEAVKRISSGRELFTIRLFSVPKKTI